MLTWSTLLAYLLVLAGSPSGHGWSLAVHLMHHHADQPVAQVRMLDSAYASPLLSTTLHTDRLLATQETPQDVADTLTTPSEAPHTDPHDDHGAHHHTADHTHAPSDDDTETRAPDHISSDAPPAWDVAHAHEGTMHTHASKPTPPESPPMTLALDKQLLVAATDWAFPPVSDRKTLCLHVTFRSHTPHTEVPPPRLPVA